MSGSHSYSVDKNGNIYKNGRFIPAKNFKYIPSKVKEKARDIKKGTINNSFLKDIKKTVTTTNKKAKTKEPVTTNKPLSPEEFAKKISRVGSIKNEKKYLENLAKNGTEGEKKWAQEQAKNYGFDLQGVLAGVNHVTTSSSGGLGTWASLGIGLIILKLIVSIFK